MELQKPDKRYWNKDNKKMETTLQDWKEEREKKRMDETGVV